MGTDDVIKMIKSDLEHDPKLNAMYLKEKRRYLIVCKIREYRRRVKKLISYISLSWTKNRSKKPKD